MISEDFFPIYDSWVSILQGIGQSHYTIPASSISSTVSEQILIGSRAHGAWAAEMSLSNGWRAPLVNPGSKFRTFRRVERSALHIFADVNECANGVHKCDTNTSSCVNTNSSYMCSCPSGFYRIAGPFACNKPGEFQTSPVCVTGHVSLYKVNTRLIWTSLHMIQVIVLQFQLISIFHLHEFFRLCICSPNLESDKKVFNFKYTLSVCHLSQKVSQYIAKEASSIPLGTYSRTLDEATTWRKTRRSAAITTEHS